MDALAFLSVATWNVKLYVVLFGLYITLDKTNDKLHESNQTLVPRVKHIWDLEEVKNQNDVVFKLQN